MAALVDFDRYPNAAKQVRNLTLLPQGGVSRRPGSRYVTEVKDSSAATYLIPFQFSETDSYMIEAGDEYFRFMRRQGVISVAANGSSEAAKVITVPGGDVAVLHVVAFTVSGGSTIFTIVDSGSTVITGPFELTPGFHIMEFTPNDTSVTLTFADGELIPATATISAISVLDDVPLEVATPYSTSDLADLRWFQGGDVVYLLHPDHAPRRLERRGDRSWSVAEAFFEDGPWLASSTLSGETAKDISVHQIVADPAFGERLRTWNVVGLSSGDSYVDFNETLGIPELFANTSGAAVLQNLANGGNDLDAGVYNIDILTLGVEVDMVAGITAGGTDYFTATTLRPGWTTLTFTATNDPLYVRFTNSNLATRAGVGALYVHKFTVGLLHYGGTSRFKGNSGSLTAQTTSPAFAPFQTSDVGRIIRLSKIGMQSGYALITGYTSATVVTIFILKTLPCLYYSDWNFSSWSADEGFPKVIGFFDGRALYANTTLNPRGLWFSQSDDLQNMAPDSFVSGETTVEADDAITLTLNSLKVDPIFWASGERELILGTAGGQWVIDSTGAVITPADRQARQQTAVSSADLNPVRARGSTIFANKSKRKLYMIDFSDAVARYVSEDLTILADHILRSPVAELAYQEDPFSTVLARREDGRLAALAFNQEHEILGWAQWILGGSFGGGDAVVEAVATIPGADDTGQVYTSDERDEVWVIAKRTIDGATVRYIEFLEGEFEGPLREDYDTEALWRTAVRTAQEDAFYVDSGLTYDGAAATVISGLEHLEGEAVAVLADGKNHGAKTVSSGSITLDYEAEKVHVGLAYKHRYEGLKMAVGAQTGTSVNKIKIITGIGLVVLDTGTFKVTTIDYDEDGRTQHDLESITFRRTGDPMGQAVPLYTGEVYKESEGVRSEDARVYIESDAPLPFTLIALAPRVETSDRR